MVSYNDLITINEHTNDFFIRCFVLLFIILLAVYFYYETKNQSFMKVMRRELPLFETSILILKKVYFFVVLSLTPFIALWFLNPKYSQGSLLVDLVSFYMIFLSIFLIVMTIAFWEHALSFIKRTMRFFK